MTMLDQAAAVPAMERRPWYRAHRFPLLPVIWTRQADRWNTFAWGLYWLNLRVWSLDSTSFLIEATIDDEGVRVGLILPYLRIVVALLPFPRSWHQRFWRKPAGCR